MHDGKALQSGTSHNFGDGFAKAFGIPVYRQGQQASVCTPDLMGHDHPMIGAIIMVHGDNSGLASSGHRTRPR